MDSRGDLELLNDDSAVEFDNLGLLAEPFQRGFLARVVVVAVVRFETVFLRSFARGRMFRPFAANADGVEFKFLSGAVFVFFQIFEQREQGRAGELAFPAACAERVDKNVRCNGLLHGI